ncbi:carboxy terminal-processing peptidase [Parapedobacter koreensis]|uniref:Carboxyl-terminal processing protease n=1 Tax=Parapedobacter koreensis TaxID=332977 RepID=A0A1H7F801_9SPHI|nr:carboxy terminal-processing peptidase [Parapedobacter koreensis]SEK22118.1 carboxyl-terminal processing protease [Parapedobacter koreensis]
MLKKVFFALFVVAIAACGSKPRVNLEAETGALKPTAQHAVIAKDVVGLFESVSYKKVPFNDSISSIIFDNLIEAMDQGKNYLMQADIDEFEQYRNTLGQDFRDGDLSAAYQIFNVYMKRYLERLDYALTQVDASHDFSVDERYVYNREHEGWFASEAEANDQWRKRVKYDLLNLRLSGNGSDSAVVKQKETLTNRYKNLVSMAKKTDNNEAFQIIMSALTNAIDPHTSYFNPFFAQRFNEEMANTFEGIGARLTSENEVIKVADVIVGGPVYKEKALQIDDRIIGVAQGEDGEFEDIIGWKLDHAVAKIKGPKGTVVRLKVVPAGQELTTEPKIVSLTRDRVVIEDESAKREIKEVVGDDGKTYRVGIISLPKFYIDFDAYRRNDPNYKSTTRDVRLLLDTLKQEKVDAVVMDLRFNGGGSLQESIELTGLFIDKGPVVQVRDTRNQVEVNSDREDGVAWDGPLGVIINRFSASASEIFAAAIQDYGRGIILGSQSYGKGTVQSAIDMSRVISPTDRLLLKAQADDGESLPTGVPQFGQINITLAKFYRITGSSTQHKGVEPDINFPSLYSAEKYGESSEPSALPWDQINAADFAPVGNLNTAITQLTAKHQSRMDGSPAYKFLLEDIDLMQKQETETSVTLQEDQLKKEREEGRLKNKSRTDALQQMKINLPGGGATTNLDEGLDFIQEESLAVMADYVALTKKNNSSL